MQHSCSHSNAICNRSFKQRIELRTTCCRTQRRNQTTAAAPAAHRRCFSSPAAATLHGKAQGFLLRLPPHDTEHATFMQPFQCDLQSQLQEKNRTTHTGTTTCCRTQRRNQTTAAATAAHTRHLSSPAAATLRGKTQGFLLRLPPHNKAHATFMQPFQCDLQPQLQETNRTTQTGTTTCCRTQRRNQTTAAATAAHTRYLPSPAAATLHGKTQGFLLRLPPHSTEHATFMQPFQCDLQPQLQETHRTTGKTQGFVLRLPPHNTEHATFMQPFQCDLQPQLQETHRITHTGTTTCCRTQRRNQTTAAATAAHMRCLSSPAADGKMQGFVLRLPPQNKAQATFMQPFQCDLQPQIPKHPITTHTQAQPKQLEATVTMRQKKKANRPQPHLPHTGGTFHRRLQPLYTEKYKVSCSGFLPKTKPMQHSCSHYNAFCSIP